MTLSDYADAVKRSVTARQAADMLGLHPNSKGFCKCPLHGEKTGSMKLYPGSRGWYCFGCHKGGSVIDLVMDYYGMPFRDAIELINSEFSLGLPIGYRPTREQEAEAKRRAAEREEAVRRRREREQKREAAYQRYLDVGAEIREMEHLEREFAPRTPDEPFLPQYIEAVNKLPVLRDEAETLAVVCFGKEDED